MRFSAASIVLLFAPTILCAQLTISYPLANIVFQRNTSNQATISVGGSYTGAVDKIEARLVAVAGGITTAWSLIDNAPTNGIYRGILNATGGWYTLEVRTILFNNVVNTTSLSYIGIGEVFAIAGQSNAQGVQDHGSLGSNDAFGRVKYIEWQVPCPNNVCQTTEFPFPITSTLGTNYAGLVIAPNGQSTWAYGELGDALISRFNVPVAFFNAGGGGSSVGNWSRSSDGLPSAHIYFGTQYGGNVLYPYYNLHKILNYYANIFGIRAILWHQGESDNLKNHDADPNNNTSSAEYRDSLQYVINKSRIHSGKSNLAWNIARASYINAPGGGPTDSEVIAGQNLTINTINKIFAGPETDNIQTPRPDGAHFENITNNTQGISQLANTWNTALDNDFFVNATPYSATSLPQLTLSCAAGVYSISAPSGYQYFWVQGDADIMSSFSNNQTVQVGAGTYRVYLKDANENIILSQAVVVPSSLPTAPTLTASSTSISAGQSVTLYAQGCSGTVNWSVGITGNSIIQTPQDSNIYSATCSIGSCVSSSSDIVILVCPIDLHIENTYTNEADFTIKASNIIYGENGNVVESGAKITYDAKKAIILKPGFQAQAGSLFEAKVGVGCN